MSKSRWTAVVGMAAALTICRDVAGAQSTVERLGHRPRTMAMLPIAMTKGTDGAKKATADYLTSVVTKAGYEILPEARTAAAMNEAGIPFVVLEKEKDKDLPGMPTAKSLQAIGEKLGADFVLAARATWHTRSIWVGLGPKTKSDCTVDMMIVDVGKRELVLDSKAVRVDSTAKEDAAKAAGAILLTPLFTAVSGGPKTPHETRAGVLAMAKAIAPWLPTAGTGTKIK